MIVFDLRCSTGHVFEAWFGSTEDFESQQARGLVSCPLCGTGEVTKALMAPRLGAGTGKDTAVANAAGEPAPSPAQVKAMLAALAKAQAKALEGSDYVGANFANQARAMHHGEVAHRPIHGRATIREAQSLVEEGVPVAPLPLPIRPDTPDN